MDVRGGELLDPAPLRQELHTLLLDLVVWRVPGHQMMDDILKFVSQLSSQDVAPSPDALDVVHEPVHPLPHLGRLRPQPQQPGGRDAGQHPAVLGKVQVSVLVVLAVPGAGEHGALRGSVDHPGGAARGAAQRQPAQWTPGVGAWGG